MDIATSTRIRQVIFNDPKAMPVNPVYFEGDPTLTNLLAYRFRMLQWNVSTTVHNQGYYPYHYIPVQVVKFEDLC